MAARCEPEPPILTWAPTSSPHPSPVPAPACLRRRQLEPATQPRTSNSGMAYKVFNPSVRSLDGIDVEKYAAMQVRCGTGAAAAVRQPHGSWQTAEFFWTLPQTRLIRTHRRCLYNP